MRLRVSRKRWQHIATTRLLRAPSATSPGEPNGGLVVLPDDKATAHRDRIIMLTEGHCLPAVYSARFFVTGLDVLWRELGSRVPANGIYRPYSVRDGNCRPSRGSRDPFATVLNIRTAKGLGKAVAALLPVAADEIIE
jgi:hypothetical protein